MRIPSTPPFVFHACRLLLLRWNGVLVESDAARLSNLCVPMNADWGDYDEES